MPRVLDLEIGKGRLALRVLAGAILSAVTFLLLSYTPSNMQEVIKKFVPADISNTVIQIASGLIHPYIPVLGALLSILIFLEVLFRKTKAYGPILIIAGLVSALYIYLAFQGGILTLVIPREYTMGVRVSAYFDLTVIMLLIMLPAILTVLKGVVMAIRHER